MVKNMLDDIKNMINNTARHFEDVPCGQTQWLHTLAPCASEQKAKAGRLGIPAQQEEILRVAQNDDIANTLAPCGRGQGEGLNRLDCFGFPRNDENDEPNTPCHPEALAEGSQSMTQVERDSSPLAQNDEVGDPAESCHPELDSGSINADFNQTEQIPDQVRNDISNELLRVAQNDEIGETLKTCHPEAARAEDVRRLADIRLMRVPEAEGSQSMTQVERDSSPLAQNDEIVNTLAPCGRGQGEGFIPKGQTKTCHPEALAEGSQSMTQAERDSSPLAQNDENGETLKSRHPELDSGSINADFNQTEQIPDQVRNDISNGLLRAKALAMTESRHPEHTSCHPEAARAEDVRRLADIRLMRVPEAEGSHDMTQVERDSSPLAQNDEIVNTLAPCASEQKAGRLGIPAQQEEILRVAQNDENGETLKSRHPELDSGSINADFNQMEGILRIARNDEVGDPAEYCHPEHTTRHPELDSGSVNADFNQTDRFRICRCSHKTDTGFALHPLLTPVRNDISNGLLRAKALAMTKSRHPAQPITKNINKNIKVKTMKKSLKLAYSFAEMCIVMVVVAIFVALMANVVPHKPKDKVAAEAHGRFECYYNSSGKLVQRMYIGNTPRTAAPVEAPYVDMTEQTNRGLGKDRCVFNPPSYARYIIIDAVGGGGGGSDDYGGSEGEFQSSFFASVQNRYYAIPGKPGAVGAAGGDTSVRLANEWENESSDAEGDVLVKARGGQTLSSLTSTDVTDVESCAITDSAVAHGRTAFDCGQTPTCEVTSSGIKVSFCRANGYYQTKTIPYKQEKNADGIIMTDDPSYIINNVVNRITTRKCSGTDPLERAPSGITYYDYRGYASDGSTTVHRTSYNVDQGYSDDGCEANVLVYHDISLWDDYRTSDMVNPVWLSNYRPSFTHSTQPSLYTMELTLDLGGSDGTDETDSNLYNFVQSMNYPAGANTLRGMHPGNGGAKKAAGHTGAVLFLW